MVWMADWQVVIQKLEECNSLDLPEKTFEDIVEICLRNLVPSSGRALSFYYLKMTSYSCVCSPSGNDPIFWQSGFIVE